MLNDFFMNQRTLHIMRLGPLGKHMDEFSEILQEENYTRFCLMGHLRGVAHISRYFLWLGLKEDSEITIEHFNKFLKEHLPICNCLRPNSYDFKSDRSAVKKIMVFLKNKGILNEEISAIEPDSIDGILIRYETYLLDILSLSPKSLRNHHRVIKKFVTAFYLLHGHLNFKHVSAAEILKLTNNLLEWHYSSDWKRNTISCIRTFLRFLYWEKIIEKDYGHIVPTIREWTPETLPQAISADEIEKLLKSPDLTTPIGKRDYAVLLTLATLGIRASELINMKLDDINWRQKYVTIKCVKSHKERQMPLSDALLCALSDYIREGRPKSLHRNIFLTAHAPCKPFGSSCSVNNILSAHLCRCHIKPPVKCGPHILRHSLATMLVNNGAPIKDISDILGHRNIETTQIYAKVNFNKLRNMVMPFPNGRIGE